jgi:hypothetical protein
MSRLLIKPLYAPACEGIRAFMSTMHRGDQSLVLQVVGDSTGDEADEWPYLLGSYLAAQFPGWAVVYHLWSDGAQDYTAPVVISSGAAGERTIDYAGGSQKARYLDPTLLGEVTGDLDVRCDVLLDDWTPAATTSLMGRWGSSTSKSWRFRVTTSGALSLEYTADGSSIVTATSSAATGFTDGQRYRVRATLDIDNGASGKDVKFWTQAIGATSWTQLGSTQTSAGTIAALNAPAGISYELGGTQSATSVISGRIYGAAIRQGIDGARISPVLLEGWANEDVVSPIAGSPTLHIYNGSAAGKDFAYFNDSTRFPKVAVPGNHPVLLLNLGHNQNQLGAAMTGLVDTFKGLVDARLPCTQIVALTQNPRLSPTVASEQYAHRSDTIARRVAKTGGGVIDTRLEFWTDGRAMSTLVNVDGIHPSSTGRAVEGAAVQRAFRAHLRV